MDNDLWIRPQRPPLSTAPPSPQRSNPATRRRKLEQDINSRDEYDNMRLRVNDLDDRVTASELKRIFQRFGKVADITIDRSEDRPKNQAFLKYELKPHDIPGLLNASLGGRLFDLDLLDKKGDSRFAVVAANSLELGVKVNQNVFCREFTAKTKVVAHFQEYRRMIKLMFQRTFLEETIEYQVEMKFQDMEKGSIQVDNLSDMRAVTIHLRFPPMYWRYDPKLESRDPSKWSIGSCLRRVVDIPREGTDFKKPVAGQPADPPTEPDPANLFAKLGKWTVIRFTVGKKSYKSLDQFVRKCKTFNLLATNVPRVVTVEDNTQLSRSRPDAFHTLAFEVQYLLESALSFSYIVSYDLTAEVGAILAALEPLKASTILEHIIALRTRVWNLHEYLTREVTKLSKMVIRPRIVPPQCVYLRKVIVTPTTMYLQPPTVETSNRIIRHFWVLSDYFLRVEFSDEGHNKLWSKDGPSNTNNAVYNRIFSTLTNGIKIGDRTYEFLAFSASQLRDNAAWFFCPQGGDHTPDSIREWMGDFSHIKSIAKYGARMGQCFSSTRAIANLAADDVKMIDDIERNNHNFSDGCGRVSWKLAQMIGIELEKETTPAAFQIRIGGSKGVLAYDPRVSDKCVQIRPSMKKFDVAHYVLEVIKTSAFIPSYLNRQIIILITALGVSDKVILDLKNSMMRDLERMESDDIIAIKMLLQNWDEGGTCKMMATMIRVGFLKRQDPFIKNLLTLFKLQMLEELSKKARIYVPKGAYLLGVCDEMEALDEGEIFVQVSSVENPTKRTVIEGKCIVVRCPCFHPGDVRVVRAVNRPQLKHLYDVVVFNTKGTRGIPSMCSGGDLDGDDFTVIWDPDIVNSIREVKPMEYVGRESVTSNAVEIVDIQRFFVQYTVSNNLGLIAHAHLALSDQLDEGPFHGKCLRLAQLHSDAVDFPKSGKAAEIKPELRPKKYPDFMEKSPEKTYISKRVLGQIYRECGKHESFKPKDYRQSFNEHLLVEGHETYLDDARRCKAMYDEEVHSLMNQYGVKSDLEVVSGFILGVDMLTNKKEHDIRKAIVSAFSGIKRKFRLELTQEFFSPDSKLVAPANLPFLEMKAAAWYAVCYQDLQARQPYTFAWIAWDTLCNIASRVRMVPEDEADLGQLGDGADSKSGSSRTSSTVTRMSNGIIQNIGRHYQESASSDMMQLAIEMERDKVRNQHLHQPGQDPLQQYKPLVQLPPGLQSQQLLEKLSLIGQQRHVHSNHPVLELDGGVGVATSSSSSSSSSSQQASHSISLLDSSGFTIDEAPRPLRNEISVQSGFLAVGPDVDAETMFKVLHHGAP
ncbi:hypothetical protein BGX28_008427 [Mortierella sp. GBA30]|nr:hypothetical protein BGX28_008427 [Mortierella sp. GBA30]